MPKKQENDFGKNRMIMPSVGPFRVPDFDPNQVFHGLFG